MILARIACFILSLAILCVPAVPSSAHDQESIFDRIRAEHHQLEKTLHSESVVSSSIIASSVASQTIDVKHYRLQIQLTPDVSSTSGTISGTVTITGETTGTVSVINIDAQPNLLIDSVKLDDALFDFRRNSNRIVLSLPSPFPAEKSFTIGIQYRGVPTTTSGLGGGMMFTRRAPNFVPVVASHSEPFAAPTWWPCIDNAADKATAEIEVTVPSGNPAASNGMLDKVRANADGTETYFWREDSPLSTYLVSVAATNYETFEDSYTALDGVTKMPLVYYVYPEHLDRARVKFAVTRPAMEIYAGLFGEYPFLGEKYGMAEFPYGGAMEHQTITSISSSLVGSVTSNNEATIVHELAHHWWGDLVTMKTWDDIWLNEGFATYSEILFFERYSNIDPGDLISRSYDDGLVDGALGGTVTAENLDKPFDDQGAIYRKGGWVLHMLRHVMGDQKFFDALKQYRTRYAFSNASTGDFQEVCEGFYGGSLDWFFKQWIYAPGRPIYKVSSDISSADASGNYAVTLVIKQKQSHQIPGRQEPVYIMPLDVTIHYADGSSETRTVWNDARKQKFNLNTTKRPIDVGLDEGHWVLKRRK
ncbi:MAG: M1 family metallopeptidase [Blastocatellia bacterium]